MKYLITLIFFTVIFASCGSGDNTEAESQVSEELIEETKTLESENEVLDETVQNIKTSTEELDKMLEEL